MTNTLTYLPGYLNVYQYALLALFGGAANVAVCWLIADGRPGPRYFIIVA
jgi:hypothetical protein